MTAPGGPRAATGLESQTGCRDDDPRKGFADLRWVVAANPGSEQRVAVTIARDGFQTGNFQVSGPLGPNQTTLRWEQLQGQAIHYWRVLTRHGQEWVPSDTASFEGPPCIGDYAR
jgi:hypothetical protein